MVLLLAEMVSWARYLRLALPARHQGWAGVVVGATTGVITGATGVFVLPAVPYLQAIGLEKDDLIQALVRSTPPGIPLGVARKNFIVLRGSPVSTASAAASWLVMRRTVMGSFCMGRSLERRG